MALFWWPGLPVHALCQALSWQWVIPVHAICRALSWQRHLGSACCLRLWSWDSLSYACEFGPMAPSVGKVLAFVAGSSLTMVMITIIARQAPP